MTVAPGAAPSVPPSAQPPDQQPGPSVWSRLLSAAAVTGLGAVAVVVAVTGAFLHRWATPAGLLLGIGGAVAVGLLARVCARSRFGLAVVAMLWLAPVWVLALAPAGADRVFLNDYAALVFLFGGTAGLAIVMGFGVEARSTRRVS